MYEGNNEGCFILEVTPRLGSGGVSMPPDPTDLVKGE